MFRALSLLATVALTAAPAVANGFSQSCSEITICFIVRSAANRSTRRPQRGLA